MMTEFFVGRKETATRRFDAEAVRKFAELVGDDNPIHLDEEFASRTRFKRCIVHGTLYSGLLGTVLGTKLPGPGTILLHQEHNFYNPVYVGDSVTAQVEISEIKPNSKVMTLLLSCVNQDGQQVLSGKAIVMVGSS